MRLVGAAALVALASGCFGPKISKQNATSIVQASTAFQHPMVAYLPRVLAIPADGIDSSAASREGAALTLIQIASVDPVVAVLRARDQIEIEDFVSAVQSSIVIPVPPDTGKAKKDSTKSDSTKSDSTKSDSTKKDSIAAPKQDTVAPRRPKRVDQGPQMSPLPVAPFAHAWVHTLRVTPRPRLEPADLAVDDGDDDEDAPRPVYNGKPIGRTPGWTLAIGTRELIRVLDVANRGTVRDDVPGDIVVDFLWRWRATRSGALFDQSGAEFQSLPKEVQQAVASGFLAIDTSSPHWSRATVARAGTGWRVSHIDWNYGEGKDHPPW
jgi:hypothetical protein